MALPAVALGLIALPHPHGPETAHPGSATAQSSRTPARAGRSACPPAGRRLLMGNGVVRVYSAPGPAPRAPVEACLVRTGARMTLIRPGLGCCASLGTVALAGSVVAFLESRFGVDSGTDSIGVVDVASRRVLRRLADVGHWVDAGILGSERVGELVVGRNGSVAWTESRRARPAAGPTFLVIAAAASGRPAVLDEGPAVDESSLRLSGSTLSWRDGGRLATARLP